MSETMPAAAMPVIRSADPDGPDGDRVTPWPASWTRSDRLRAGAGAGLMLVGVLVLALPGELQWWIGVTWLVLGALNINESRRSGIRRAAREAERVSRRAPRA